MSSAPSPTAAPRAPRPSDAGIEIFVVAAMTPSQHRHGAVERADGVLQPERPPGPDLRVPRQPHERGPRGRVSPDRQSAPRRAADPLMQGEAHMDPKARRRGRDTARAFCFEETNSGRWPGTGPRHAIRLPRPERRGSRSHADASTAGSLRSTPGNGSNAIMMKQPFKHKSRRFRRFVKANSPVSSTLEYALPDWNHCHAVLTKALVAIEDGKHRVACAHARFGAQRGGRGPGEVDD